MAKFAVGNSSIAPVLGAGVSFRHINNFGDIPSSLLTLSTAGNSVGFVGGGGLRVRMGPVSITPEVRYTRWNGSSLTQSLVDTVLGSQNQLQVLIGVTF